MTTPTREQDDFPVCRVDRRREIRNLEATIAEQEAEIERLKAVPMKYRRMQFNAELQDENNALRQQLTTLQSKADAREHALEFSIKWLDANGYQLMARKVEAALATYKE